MKKVFLVFAATILLSLCSVPIHAAENNKKLEVDKAPRFERFVAITSGIEEAENQVLTNGQNWITANRRRIRIISHSLSVLKVGVNTVATLTILYESK